MINYYVELVINYNLSVRQLRVRIKNKEYERLPTIVKNSINAKNELSLV